MRTRLCLPALFGLALLGLAALTDESDAGGFLPRHQNVTQVNINAGGGVPQQLNLVQHPHLFPRQNVTQINVGVPPAAIVNHQLLVDPRFRGQLNQLNSYTYTNTTAQNIRFVPREAVLLNRPVIVSAPITEQLVYHQPATVIQQIQGPRNCTTTTTQGATATNTVVSPSDPSVQYLQQPQQLNQTQNCPQCQQQQALTQPQQQQQQVQQVQQVQQTRVYETAPSQVLQQIVTDPGVHVIQQTRVINRPLAVRDQHVFLHENAVLSRRHFVQHLRGHPLHGHWHHG